jgi:DNA ligase 4
MNAKSVNDGSACVAGKQTFYTFATCLEKISKVNDKVGITEKKKEIVSQYINQWRNDEKKLKLNNLVVESSMYPAIRFFCPNDDRRVYGLKENKLAKYLIHNLGISVTSPDALKLLNYRAPNNVRSDGDFASVAYFVLKSRCSDDKTHTLTIEEVNKHLDTIAINNSKGKEGQEKVNAALRRLLSMTALQLKWLIRVMLKDLKIGLKEHAILDAYHPDAFDLFNCSTDLQKVCDQLNDPTKRLHEVGISFGSPCRPMLGKLEEFSDSSSFDFKLLNLKNR